MLSIELIRRDPDQVRQALASRGEEGPLDQLLELNTQVRRTINERDNRNAERNQVAKEIGNLKKSGQNAAEDVIIRMREVGDLVNQLNHDAKELNEQINEILLGLPNLPLAGVPEGGGEVDNVVARSWGEIPTRDFVPIPHWELAETQGLIDFQRGVKVSGSRFFTMSGMAAKLNRALISWMLDLHTGEHGYTEVTLPLMVKKESMVGSGNLPKFADNLYHDAEDDLWLIPTAEVPITNLHRDEILSAGQLPIKYVAHTPCFRREKAAAGRDTRGIKRVHQFDKVEMYKLVTPESSEGELEKLLANAEEVCRRLQLPYRVLQLCTGDLGFQSAKTYDIEVWAAGCQEWLEVSSCSTCTDFQARRANIRYRPSPQARPQFVHTLNGSGLALPRVIISILENYQEADGSVRVPEVLRPYTGFDTIPAVPSQ